LVEVRDSAIHFINKGLQLERTVQELGAACLKNYLNAVRQWFGLDLSTYNFFIMPLAFFRDLRSAEALALSGEERKLLAYLSQRVREGSDDPASDFSVALRFDIRLVRASEGAPAVVVSREPGAIPVTLEEEDIRQQYPWTYDILCTRLRKRYSDFKMNEKFHRIRRPLEADPRYCRVRLLDPGNPRSGQKRFYSPNIVREFDRQYAKAPDMGGRS
jgi:hypothetical protein